MPGINILITAGGTEEPIDGVRTINNFSTGSTGAVIADIFNKSGFNVTLLTAKRGIKPETDVEVLTYQSFSDINNCLKELLGNREFFGIIHAAAISDYSVDYLESSGIKIIPDCNIKLDSSRPLTITLKPNFKIIDRLKEYSSTPLVVVGFKLTKNANSELIKIKVESMFKDKKVDYLVHNDLSSINNESHKAHIYMDNKGIKETQNKKELGYALVEILKKEQ